MYESVSWSCFLCTNANKMCTFNYIFMSKCCKIALNVFTLHRKTNETNYIYL